ncbi:ABC transporter G family member 31 [Bienertia sinuspersici]
MEHQQYHYINTHLYFVFLLLTAHIGGIKLRNKFLTFNVKDTYITYGNIYLACLLYRVTQMMFNGIMELALMIFQLPVLYKQRDNCFYPAWAWSHLSWVLCVSYSIY